MTDETKHTPGPWRVEDGTTLVWGNCNPDDNSSRGMGYPIAESRINPSGNWSTGPYADEGEANARLIAAAPELLEALKAAVSQVHLTNSSEPMSPDVKRVFDQCCAAIAKAEGK